MSDWQIIETAPRCASKWLVVGMLDTERFPAPTWRARFVGGFWEDEERRICAPTHWMPGSDHPPDVASGGSRA